MPAPDTPAVRSQAQLFPDMKHSEEKVCSVYIMQTEFVEPSLRSVQKPVSSCLQAEHSCQFRMGVKLGLPSYVNIDCGCLRTEYGDEYLDLGGRMATTT